MADKLRIVNRGLQRIGAKRLTTLTDNSRERFAIDAAYTDIVEQELRNNLWSFAIRRIQIPADNEQYAESAVVAAGGTGYAVDDTLTLSGGTGTAAILRVDSVSSGAVTEVSVTETPGLYTVVPTNPAATTSSGAGTGCTLTVTYNSGPLFGPSFQYTKPADFLRSAPRDPKEISLIKSCLFEGDKIVSNESGPLQLRYISDLSVLPAGITNMEELFDPLFANAVSMRLAAETCEELTGNNSKLDRVESAYTFFVNQARKVNSIEQGPIEPEIDIFAAVRIQDEVDPTLRPYSG